MVCCLHNLRRNPTETGLMRRSRNWSSSTHLHILKLGIQWLPHKITKMWGYVILLEEDVWMYLPCPNTYYCLLLSGKKNWPISSVLAQEYIFHDLGICMFKILDMWNVASLKNTPQINVANSEWDSYQFQIGVVPSTVYTACIPNSEVPMNSRLRHTPNSKLP